MAKYTIELRELEKGMKVFDFDYEFYCDDIEVKKNFEKKFLDYYFFSEIGFETIARFKHYLRSTLNLKMDYYKQLYYTELKSKDIDFLLNKDYTETYIKEIDKSLSGEGKSTSDNISSTNGGFKESSLDNGNATLDEESLTSISDTVSSNSDKGNLTSTSKSSEKEIESNTLIGKGNIGITSSAELLEKWRSVIININEMLIKECEDLFMGVY